jgi:hypothetical protein
MSDYTLLKNYFQWRIVKSVAKKMMRPGLSGRMNQGATFGLKISMRLWTWRKKLIVEPVAKKIMFPTKNKFLQWDRNIARCYVGLDVRSNEIKQLGHLSSVNFNMALVRIKSDADVDFRGKSDESFCQSLGHNYRNAARILNEERSQNPVFNAPYEILIALNFTRQPTQH